MRRRLHRRERKIQRRKVIIFSIALLLCLSVGYAAYNTNISLKAKGNIKDKSRIIQSWYQSSDEDFHTDYYRGVIVSATFVDSAQVPNNAVQSWDVSENKDKGVMAYIVESSSESGMYDLYIGAKHGVIANEDSSALFFAFYEIKTIDFGNNFDTSNVIDMTGMFSECKSLTNLNVSNFDTSNVTDMSYMFYDCSSLTSLDLSNFNTSNVTNMSQMFMDCRSLISLDLSSFDTSKVTNMYNMFWECSGLTSLDISKFDTSNVTNMSQMFEGCSSITKINLCSFNTLLVTNTYHMFAGNYKLTQVTVGSNWTIETTDDIFEASGVSSVTTGQC